MHDNFMLVKKNLHDYNFFSKFHQDNGDIGLT